jgi:hypothetical protein
MYIPIFIPFFDDLFRRRKDTAEEAVKLSKQLLKDKEELWEELKSIRESEELRKQADNRRRLYVEFIDGPLKGNHPMKLTSLDPIIVRSGELYQKIIKNKVICYKFVEHYIVSDNEKKMLKSKGLKEKTFPSIEDELSDS